MLKLSRVAPHEWKFVHPPPHKELMTQFDAGCELYEEDDLDRAEGVFRDVLAQMPDHLDALHHLALVLSERGLKGQAVALWEQSVRIGRGAFPDDFDRGADQLRWGWLDNRPFLRCLCGLLLVRLEVGDVEGALELCEESLRLNPGDNQGVRALAIEALFRLGRFEDALEITQRYPDDVMPETVYGQALALFKLKRRREATMALRKAMRRLPLVARELLKARHRRPKTATADMVEIGGADEAYYYWKQWGEFWEETPRRSNGWGAQPERRASSYAAGFDWAVANLTERRKLSDHDGRRLLDARGAEPESWPST